MIGQESRYRSTAKDVYQVEDYETLRDDKWTLTGDWKKFEYTFKPNYEPSKTPDSNVIPRTPFMYIDVDGNKAGTKFLVDDITFEDADAIIVEPEVNPYPRLENVELVSGDAVSGATVQIDYEFVSEVEEMMGGRISSSCAHIRRRKKLGLYWPVGNVRQSVIHNTGYRHRQTAEVRDCANG